MLKLSILFFFYVMKEVFDRQKKGKGFQDNSKKEKKNEKKDESPLCINAVERLDFFFCYKIAIQFLMNISRTLHHDGRRKKMKERIFY